MKIVQLCAIDQTMSIFLKELNKGLINEDCEVLCVCSHGPYTESIKNEGFNIVNISIERNLSPLPAVRAIYKLYKLFKTEKPDVVHVHTPIAAVLGRLAAKLAGVPTIIYTAHGFYFHEGMSFLKYKLFLHIEKFMAKYFTHFIFTQSEEDRQTAIKNNFISEDKVLNIGNGVDISHRFNPENVGQEEITQLYEELNLSKENKIITFIGRLVEEKGIFDLLEAFSKVNNDKVKLLVVGDVDQGSRDNNTKAIILSKYKDNENIVFTGFRSDINNILYITDIFCLPSYREGMPRSIIEAMAMECAVIATNIRGCREEVIDGKTGFLVNTNRPEEIEDQIKQLIMDENKLNHMKKMGRKRAEKYFDEQRCVKKQIKVIKMLYQQYCKNR